MQIMHTKDNDKAIEFMRKNGAGEEQVDLSESSFWCVAVVDNEVVGVAGVNIGKYADRIKGFFVAKEMRNQGIGTALLQDAMKYTKAGRVTAYCTRNSEPLFIKEGFEVTREPNRYGISFTEWRREP